MILKIYGCDTTVVFIPHYSTGTNCESNYLFKGLLLTCSLDWGAAHKPGQTNHTKPKRSEHFHYIYDEVPLGPVIQFPVTLTRGIKYTRPTWKCSAAETLTTMLHSFPLILLSSVVSRLSSQRHGNPDAKSLLESELLADLTHEKR